MIRKRDILYFFLLIFSFINSSVAEITLVVLNTVSEKNTRAKWEAMAFYLEESICEKVNLEISDVDSLKRKAKRESAQIFFADPITYVELEKELGVIPLATRVLNVTNKSVSKAGGVLIIRKDRDVYKLKEISELKIAVPRDSDFYSYRAILRKLLANNLDIKKMFYKVARVNTSKDVVKAVVNRVAQVGGLKTGVLEEMKEEGKIKKGQIRVLSIEKGDSDYPFVHSTSLYPEWPMFSLKSLSEEKRDRIKKALLSMEKDSSAARATNINAWVEAADYSDVISCLKDIKYGSFYKLSAIERLRKIGS